MAAGLTACATNTERYQSAMRQVMGFNWTEPQPDPDPTPQPDPDPAPAVPQYADWPEDLPPVANFAFEFPRFMTGETFHASYLVTQSVYQTWVASLVADGFSGDPLAVRDNYAVEHSAVKIEDSALYYLQIKAYPYIGDTTWPEEFAVFPEFTGEGTLASFDMQPQPNQGYQLTIVSEGESHDAVAAYIRQLQAAGFVDQGYGYYGKEVGDYHYQFETDGIWTDETTAVLNWYAVNMTT